MKLLFLRFYRQKLSRIKFVFYANLITYYLLHIYILFITFIALIFFIRRNFYNPVSFGLKNLWIIHLCFCFFSFLEERACVGRVECVNAK